MDGRRSSDPNVSELLIDWHKSVAVVSDLGRQHASGAEVPVRAVQALVADTRNVLVTAITDSVVEVVAARLHLGSDVVRHLGVLDSRDKTVLGMVTMSVLGEACLAQVKVFTDSAVEELDLGEFSNTTVASSHDAEACPSSSQRLEHGANRGNLILGLNLGFNLGLDLRLDLGLNGGLNLDLGLRLRGDGLGGALHELAVDSRALDQPVVLAVAGDSLVDAGLAEVKVSVVASGAVVVNIRDGQLAAVAADGKGSASGRADGGSLAGGENTGLGDIERGLMRVGQVVTASSGGASRLSLSLHKVGKSSLKVQASVTTLSDVSSGIVEESCVVGARKRADADGESRLRRCGGRDWSRGGSLSRGSGNGADFVILALLSGVLGRLLGHLGDDGGCESLRLVFDSDGLGDSLGQVLDGDADLELRLGLGSAVKLLINRDVAGLK
jgi:hypothetical protein